GAVEGREPSGVEVVGDDAVDGAVDEVACCSGKDDADCCGEGGVVGGSPGDRGDGGDDDPGDSEQYSRRKCLAEAECQARIVGETEVDDAEVDGIVAAEGVFGPGFQGEVECGECHDHDGQSEPGAGVRGKGGGGHGDVSTGDVSAAGVGAGDG